MPAVGIIGLCSPPSPSLLANANVRICSMDRLAMTKNVSKNLRDGEGGQRSLIRHCYVL